MSLRDLADKNPNVARGVAGVVLLISLVILFGQLSGNQRGPAENFFYDLTTGDLVEASPTEAPPITLSSGNPGVLAHLFTCNECTDQDRFIGYLEKYSNAAKTQLTKELPDQQIVTDGLLVALPADELNWVMLNSPEGADVIMAPQRKCETLKTCRP